MSKPMNYSPYYMLDKDHNVVPCTLEEWSLMLQNTSRVVAATHHPRDYHISTVFLGISISFIEGAPRVFETMVFDSDGKEWRTYRYTTWDEAVEGHARAWVLVEPDRTLEEARALTKLSMAASR